MQQAESECYECVISSRELRQGDIIRDCPVFKPPADFPWPLSKNEQSVDMVTETQDLVVLSQTCDLVPGQKNDMWLVVMCPLWSLEEVSKENAFLASGYGRETCKLGGMPGYYMLPTWDNKQISCPISVVSFREVWSLPLSLVARLAEELGPRIRLKSPYREHLAQAFGRYFMRVAVDYDQLFPSFANSKEENEIMKAFKKLDSSKRDKIIDAMKQYE